MDATSSGTSSFQYHESANQALASIIHHPVPYEKRVCSGNASPGEFPLSDKPYIVLHVLTVSNLDPQDLAKLEVNLFCYMMILVKWLY